MPSNVKKGTIMSGGAGGTSPGSKSVMCKAFNDAVKAWCAPDRKKGQGKTFNDYYFEALEKKGKAGKALADSMQREVPILVNRSSAQTLTSAAGARSASGRAAARLNRQVSALRRSAQQGTTTWNGFRWAALLASWRTPNLRGWLRFPDAMLPDGTPVEIKGPGDTARKNQFRDYKRASPNGEAIEISCESCGNDCAQGNKCPPQK